VFKRVNSDQIQLFKRVDFDQIQLVEEMIDGKRYYGIEGGEKFPSVTTVLSNRYNPEKKEGLRKWREKVGDEEANRITRYATKRGTGMHNICERFMLNEENIYRNEMPTAIQLFKQIKDILVDNINEVYGNEVPLYSTTLRTAGRTDVICQYNGVNSIVDFKTSGRDKNVEWIEDYFLQSTAYAYMVQEMYNLNVPQIVIIIAVEEGENKNQVFIKKTRDYMDQMVSIFQEKRDY
jgi:genome maintenance exonuclease 1